MGQSERWSCKHNLGKFDLSTKKIKEEFRNQCNQFAQLLNCNYSINDDAEKELFESINEEKKKSIKFKKYHKNVILKRLLINYVI